jgi:hypothetical protein
MALGVRRGIGRANMVLMPLLTVMFVILVVQSLFLPGAMEGLNAFFTPNWEALANPAVWASAYGHIFFSLSVAFGIMAVAFVAVIVVAWLLGKLPTLQAHLNERSSFRIGVAWKVLIAGLAPVVLGYLFVSELIAKISDPYGGYPAWFLAVFGWGMVVALVVLALLLSLLPWSGRSRAKDDPEYDDFLTEEHYDPDPETDTVRVPVPPTSGERS